jgi:cytochrome P450
MGSLMLGGHNRFDGIDSGPPTITIPTKPQASQHNTRLPNRRNRRRKQLATRAVSAASASEAPTALPSVLQALAQGAARLQRTLTPPPPGFPPGPRNDVSIELLRDPLAFLEQTQRRYGDVVGVLLAGERAVIVTEPDVAKHVLIEAQDVFVKAGTAFFPGSSLAGNGLLVSDGPVWKRQRQLATPAFRRAAVERYAEAMISCTQQTLIKGKKWRPGAIRDVYADFNELTLRITLSALFGADVDSTAASNVTSSIREAFEHFARRAATAFVVPEAVPTPDNLRFAAAVARLDEAVYDLIARRRERLESKTITSQRNQTLGNGRKANHGSNRYFAPTTRTDQDSSIEEGTTTNANTSTMNNTYTSHNASDLMDSLLLARDDANSGMDDVSLRDELMTLLVAGQETSAILLGWTCALLAAHPTIQRRAAQEIASVLGNRSPVPQDAHGRLPYLEAVVLETLRIMPPAYMVGRCASRDTELAGYPVPAGTTVLISPYVMHRDARRWSHALEFRPERWLDGDGSATPIVTQSSAREGKPLYTSALAGMGPNGAYIPFGAGQRNCIGAGFAMMEALLVMAAVLQRFELVGLPNERGRLPNAEPRITLRPERVRLILRARKGLQKERNPTWGVDGG